MTLLTLDLIYSEILLRLEAVVNTGSGRNELRSYAYKMFSVVFLSAKELFSLLLDRQLYMVLLISSFNGFGLLQLSFVHDSH